MEISKEELKQKIENARKMLNNSIDSGDDYENVYNYSVELDKLIELYIVSEY